MITSSESNYADLAQQSWTILTFVLDICKLSSNLFAKKSQGKSVKSLSCEAKRFSCFSVTKVFLKNTLSVTLNNLIRVLIK